MGQEAPPANRPVVVYANHHLFYDGYLLAFFLERVLGRRAVVWMQDLARFPFFAAGGAAPFPKNRPARRAATIRRTARMMRQDERTALIYFPEGILHEGDGAIRSFPQEVFARYDGIFPAKNWWPIALATVDRHRARPTAVLHSGSWHGAASGRERVTLQELLAAVRPDQDSARLLLKGRADPDERWGHFGRRFRES